MPKQLKISIVLILSTAFLFAEQIQNTNNPNWLSILPPLVAIILALVTRETLV